MKKGTLITIGLIFGALAGGAFWWYRKKKGEKELPVEENKETGSGTQTTVKPASSTTTTKTTTTLPGQSGVQSTAPVTTAPAPADGKFLTVINVGGKAALQGVKAAGYKAGDKVTVPSGSYAGTHTLTYVYTGTQGGVAVQNLYLPVPFTKSESGTVLKASGMVAV